MADCMEAPDLAIPESPLKLNEAMPPAQGLATCVQSPLPEAEPEKGSKARQRRMPATQKVLQTSQHPKDLIFERPLRLWLPFHGLPAPVVIHEHERLELRSLSGEGRLLLHGHTHQGEPIVIGAPLIDTAAFLRPCMTHLSCKRSFPYLPGHTLAFSAEPSSEVNVKALAFTRLEEPDYRKDGLAIEFAILAKFSSEERLSVPKVSTRLKGFSDHPVRRIFTSSMHKNDQEHHKKKTIALVNGKPNPEDRLPQLVYNPPAATTSPSPQQQRQPLATTTTTTRAPESYQKQVPLKSPSFPSPVPPDEGSYFERRAASAVFPPPRAI